MEFKDRTSQYPGRVKLTPVSGQTDVYDMTWADSASVTGTPLNKATFEQLQEELSDLIVKNAGAKGDKGDKGDSGVTLDKKTFLVGTNSSSGAGWYKLGSVSFSNYYDYHAKILVTRTYYGMSMPCGLIDIDVRYGNATWESTSVKWETFSGKNPNYIGYYTSPSGVLTLYAYIPQQYAHYRIDVLSESNRDVYANLFQPIVNYGGVWQTRYSTSTPTLTGYPTKSEYKFYSWVYSSKCSSDVVVSCTQSIHGIETVYGAIVVPRSTATSTSDLSGYSNITTGTNRYGVTINGTTVCVTFDDGAFELGFYCLIYGV